MAVLFSEYMEAELDVLKVVKMVLIHDLVEIYAGDTFCFDEVGMGDKDVLTVERNICFFMKNYLILHKFMLE